MIHPACIVVLGDSCVVMSSCLSMVVYLSFFGWLITKNNSIKTVSTLTHLVLWVPYKPGINTVMLTWCIAFRMTPEKKNNCNIQLSILKAPCFVWKAKSYWPRLCWVGTYHNNFRQERGMGKGLVPFYKTRWSSYKFSALECNRTRNLG